MKRRLLPAVFLLAAAFSGAALSAVAQATHQYAAAPMRNPANAKVTATAPRLIASYGGRGSSIDVLIDQDSASYIYSGTAVRVDHAGNPLPDTEVVYHLNPLGTMLVPVLLYTHWYDAQNRDTLQTTLTYTDGAWLAYSKMRHYPNAAGQDTLMLVDNYNAPSSSFQPSARYHYTYDASGDTLAYLQERMTAGVWTGYFRMASTYNGAGKMLTMLTETATAGAWTGIWRYTNTYNPANQPLVQLIESFTNGAWKGSTRVTYSYDASGADTGLIREGYNNGWKNTSRYSYLYDAGGHQTSTVSWSWDAGSGSWIVAKRNIYTLNALYQRTVDYSQILYGATMRNFDSTIYAYDAAGNITSRLLFRADTNKVWQPSERNTYTFTATGKPGTELDETYNLVSASFGNALRFAYFYNAFDQKTRVYKQEWISGAWVYGASSDESRYYYEPSGNLGVAGTPGLSEADVRLYPVPADGRTELLISFGRPQHFTASVADAAGRVIMSWSDTGYGLYSRSIATAGLASGVYYFSIRSEAGTASRPLIVCH